MDIQLWNDSAVTIQPLESYKAVFGSIFVDPLTKARMLSEADLEWLTWEQLTTNLETALADQRPSVDPPFAARVRFGFWSWVAKNSLHNATDYERRQCIYSRFQAAINCPASATFDQLLLAHDYQARESYFEQLLKFEEYLLFDDIGSASGLPKVVGLDESTDRLLTKTASGAVSESETEVAKFYARKSTQLQERVLTEFALPRYRLRLTAETAWHAVCGAVDGGTSKRSHPVHRRADGKSVTLTQVVALALLLASLLLLAIQVVSFLRSLTSYRHWASMSGLQAVSWSAVGFLVSLCLLAIVGGPFVAHALLLRIPACTLIGLSLLVTVFNDNQLFQQAGPSLLGPTILVIFVWLYLAIEVRSHRVSGSDTWKRSLGVLSVAIIYALTISSAVVAFVIPVLRHASWHAIEKPNHFGSIVFATAAGSLVIGVFLQVMWDDRPITAALGRRTWRSQP